MTRVLRVITRLNIGGPSRQVLLLSKALRPEFETLVAAGRAPSREGEMTDPEVAIQRVSLQRAPHPFADMRTVSELGGLISSWQPAIVHTHHAKAGALGRVAVLRSRHQCATVHTFHGHVLNDYFGRIARAGLIRAERWLARRTTLLIAVSHEVRDELLGLGIGAKDQWRVIPLGFDLEPFLRVGGRSGLVRTHLGLDADTPLVGVFGRLAPIKDHRTLLEAVARLPDVHLAIFGDGELHDELQSRARTLGIQGQVHFMGWWESMPEAVADMDVVALTSRNEGTPVSLIEASACAKPVVATDVGGVSAVVVDGHTGFLTPAGDAGSIASYLDRLMHDRRLRAQLGDEGRAHVRDRFSKERLVRDIQDLYRGLVPSA